MEVSAKVGLKCPWSVTVVYEETRLSWAETCRSSEK